MAAPEPDFLQAVRDYAALSGADRRAIDQRLSPEQRAQIKAALKRVVSTNGVKAATPPGGAAFSACSPALATHLSKVLSASGGVTNVTEQTKRAVMALAQRHPGGAT